MKEHNKPISNTQRLENLISAQPFFQGMEEKHIKLLADLAMETEFAVGQPIFTQGDPANRFYLILNGAVELTSKSDKGKAITVRILWPGQNLGWSWLFEPYVFYISARPTEPTKVIFFYGTALRQRCEDDRDFGYEIMKRVAKNVVESFGVLQKSVK